MQLIRYANRKLYDKALHRYVNLTQVKSTILEGKDVIVTDLQGNIVTQAILNSLASTLDLRIDQIRELSKQA